MTTPPPIEYADASPQVRAVYDDIKRTRNVPDVNNFWKYLARDPATLKRTWESIKEIMAPGALDPLTKEMVYLAVSVTNGCAYCVAHHAEALSRYEKDGDLLAAVREGRWNALGARTEALCRYAEKLTRDPESVREADVAFLRETGFDDRAILVAAQIAAYFNFVNRLVLGLGVGLEPTQLSYKY